MTVRVPRRRVFHVHHGTPYHVEDSVRGVQAAVEGGFTWIDLDCHVTSDDVLVITHWPRPMEHDGFVDPQGKIRPGAEIEHLTWGQVRRLRTMDTKPYRISRADVLVSYTLAHGIKVELELKSSAITTTHLSDLRAGLDNPDAVQIKTLVSLPPAPWERLQRAHDAGYATILLIHSRGVRVPDAFEPTIDFFRGHPPIFVSTAP